jgi:hypothetical protein
LAKAECDPSTGRVDVSLFLLLNFSHGNHATTRGARGASSYQHEICFDSSYGIAAALPHFRKATSGHFINISSVAGIKVFAPGASVSSAAKFAGHALSESLPVETRKDNIRLTILSPGA